VPRERQRGQRGDQGLSTVDLLIAVMIVASISALAAPVAASVTDSSRLRHAAAFVSSRFRLARLDALNRGANVAVVFDRAVGRWTIRVCRDGNRNGIRRADIASGADPCFDGPYAVGDLFPHVNIDVDATLRGPAGEAPSPDAVRFGSSDLVSFSATGSCTAGSVFLRSTGSAQFVVRVAGINSRIRVMRYDSPRAGWLSE
jgi:hypothetical protein